MKAVFVDDDSDALLSLVRALKVALPELNPEVATSALKALTLVSSIKPEVVVLDLCIDVAQGVQSGFSLLEQLLMLDPTLRVLVLTGQGSNEHGIRALNMGAASFLEKPADINHLAALIRDAERQCSLRRSYLTIQARAGQELERRLVGSSLQMQKLHEEIRLAARTPQPVLILGETGTGKGVCARLIHEIGPRSAKRFVRYQPNFAGVDLVNSELFGHVKGSFTGAGQDRVGLIAEAEGGTLFLDEVEELPLETQVALLGVLQERNYRSVGANKESSANFRLICASNRDTTEMMEQGKLRPDFYHRLAHHIIRIPALREHPEDICALAEHFLAELGRREAMNVFDMNDEAKALLGGYSWPGNVRELQAVVESAAYRAQFAGRTRIEQDDIIILSNQAPALEFSSGLNEQVESFRLRLIEAALSKHKGNQVQAARTLQIDRSTLRRVIARGQISPECEQ